MERNKVVDICPVCNSRLRCSLEIINDEPSLYKTPTDEDAKLRPTCEVWEGNLTSAVTGMLVAVTKCERSPFVMVNDLFVPTMWRNCRILKEE